LHPDIFSFIVYIPAILFSVKGLSPVQNRYMFLSISQPALSIVVVNVVVALSVLPVMLEMHSVNANAHWHAVIVALMQALDVLQVVSQALIFSIVSVSVLKQSFFFQ